MNCPAMARHDAPTIRLNASHVLDATGKAAKKARLGVLKVK